MLPEERLGEAQQKTRNHHLQPLEGCPGFPLNTLGQTVFGAVNLLPSQIPSALTINANFKHPTPESVCWLSRTGSSASPGLGCLLDTPGQWVLFLLKISFILRNSDDSFEHSTQKSIHIYLKGIFAFKFRKVLKLLELFCPVIMRIKYFLTLYDLNE